MIEDLTIFKIGQRVVTTCGGKVRHGEVVGEPVLIHDEDDSWPLLPIKLDKGEWLQDHSLFMTIVLIGREICLESHQTS